MTQDLLPIVYEELRALAGVYMQGERLDHTLQPTALVHEAFVRLSGKDARWNDRAHFCRVAARAMRRILVNHARDHRRQKRGGAARKLELTEVDVLSNVANIDLIALDEALERFTAIDPRKVQIAQLRYFGGFSINETAEILEISVAQVKREWVLARAWLLRELDKESM